MTRRIAVSTILAAVVLAAAFWFGAWRPASAHLKAADANLVQARQLQAQLVSQVGSLRKASAHMGSYQAQLDSLTASVPASPSLDTAIDRLAKVATVSGVQLVAVDPSSPAPAPAPPPAAGPAGSTGPPSIHLQLSLTGTYAQLTSFIDQLDGSPRLFVVHDLTMAPAAKSMTASMQTEVFYSNPALAPVTGGAR
ncbi:MAG: type II secretion system protein GspM [Acidimicrobiales bacterium]